MPDGRLCLIDWKRSKKLREKYHSVFGNMACPVNHIPDCAGRPLQEQISCGRVSAGQACFLPSEGFLGARALRFRTRPHMSCPCPLASSKYRPVRQAARWHYRLQLNLYRYIIQKYYGLEVACAATCISRDSACCI